MSRCSILDFRFLALGCSAVAASFLAVAYVAEWGFGYAPCVLCLWQRLPYACAFLIGALAWRYRSYAAWAVLGCVLAFAVAAGLGWYHVGVEHDWFSSSCSASSGDLSSLDAMRAAILEAPLVSCNQPTAVFFGFSMAFWHALGATLLTLLTGGAALWVKVCKGGRHD